MKSILALCALLIQFMPALPCSSPSPPQQKKQSTGAKSVQRNRGWRAGTYLGLTAGTSRRADVLRILGEPKRLDAPADQMPNEPNLEVWYVYDSAQELPGELTVIVDKRTEVVLGIDLNPDSLSKEDAVKHLGPDYILTRYNFDDCLGDEESAPLYESANGPLLEIEYRHRGIAVSVSNDGKVNTISYISKPIGTSKSRCKGSTGYQSSIEGEIPTVSLCDLLANPGTYDLKVIRVQAVLVVNNRDRSLYDPSCITMEPMVGVEPDPSLHHDPGFGVEKKFYDLVKGERETKEARVRMVMVGRFEGPNFSKDGRDSRFQHQLILMRIEKAEP